jgi:GTP-binding protein HflX
MGKQKTYDTAIVQERAILVGVVTPGEKEAQTKEYLDELAFLGRYSWRQGREGFYTENA